MRLQPLALQAPARSRHVLEAFARVDDAASSRRLLRSHEGLRPDHVDEELFTPLRDGEHVRERLTLRAFSREEATQGLLETRPRIVARFRLWSALSRHLVRAEQRYRACGGGNEASRHRPMMAAGDHWDHEAISAHIRLM
jgi:hypothetical protein